MKGSTKAVVASLLMVAAFSYLVLIGMKEGSMYYLEVNEFFSRMKEVGQDKVRINGEVVKGSVMFNSRTRLLTFSLKDTKSPDVLKVRYKGTPPDLLGQEGVTLVAEGSYDAGKNVFVARKLLVKCPSKYEKKEETA